MPNLAAPPHPDVPLAPDPNTPLMPEAPVSYEAFLEWADEDTRAEWVDGNILPMSPASNRHQDVTGFFVAALRALVEDADAGTVRDVPFQMRLDERPSGREPDVLFVKAEHRDRLKETHLDGPADLVIEVVSPSSDARDRGDKFVEYEAAGIPEYWIVDPLRRDLVVYRLGDDGRYHAAFSGTEGRVESDVIDGLWVEASWFWQDDLPRVVDVLRQWDVI